MQIVLGVIFHFLGGFASGSFYMPYKKVNGWNWESFWIVGGLFSWLIVPPLAAYLTIPDFMGIIAGASPAVLGSTFLMGILWGIGGLTYGLGVRYLGVSLGSSIILGLCSFFGALVPAIYYYFNPTVGKDTIVDLFSNSWGRWVIFGLLVCIAGIIWCGRAGASKEREIGTAGQDGAKNEFQLSKGLVLAIVSGVLSACFSFGIEAGSSMAEQANAAWLTRNPNATEGFLYRNNVVFVVILWGGLLTNLCWTMFLNMKHRSFGDYVDRSKPLLKNYVWCALAGTTWFLQFFFYGMGESKLGNGASSWILHMSFIILVANLWGLFTGEWKGVSKHTSRDIIVGIGLIILSVCIVGYGNSLK
jgi:L-rhamnose-H+ transport protein